MCKLFMMSLLILTTRLSLSSSKNNSIIEEKIDSYESQLNRYAPDVKKFVEDGWEKLVTEGRTKIANKEGGFFIDCARVQVVNSERRYTILVTFFPDSPNNAFLHCTIFAWTDQTDPIYISCQKGNADVSMKSNPHGLCSLSFVIN